MVAGDLVIRVAANLDELKQNLAEGGDAINVTAQGLAKLSASYDGSKIIQQANATAAAIQQIGGVTTLTAAEQAKANTVLQAALDKYALLGKEAPAGMQQLADATRQVVQPTDDLGQSWVARIAEGLLLRDAIREVLSYTKELILGIPEEAKQLSLLSLQTRISIEDLQVLQDATKEYGIDGDELGRALFQLQQRIAGGDQSVATAYHLMGLSLEEVKNKNAFDLFMTTERGLGELSGAIQDTAAKDLYGGRLGASLIAFSKGADDAVARARAFNTLASTESVKAAAEYADAIDRMTRNLHAWVMEAEGGVAQGVNVLTDAAGKGASSWDLFKAVFVDWTNSSIRVGAHTDALATLLDHLNQTTAAHRDITLASASAHDTATKALDAHAQATKFMNALELDAAAPLLAWQVQYLNHLKDIGQLTAQNAAALGVNSSQFDKYKASVEAASKAESEANATALSGYESRIKSLQDVAKASLAAYGFDAQIAALSQLDAAERALSKSVFDNLTTEKDRAKVIEETTKRHIELMNQEMAIEEKKKNLVNAAVLAEFEAQVQLNAAWGRDASGALLTQQSAINTLNLAMDALHAKKIAGISQEKEEQVLIDAYTKALYDEAVAQDNLVVTNQKVAQSWGEIADAAARAAGVTVVGNRPGEGGTSGTPTTGPSGSFSFGGGATDPRVVGLVSSGYTLSEALAIAGGYGFGIGAPQHRAAGGTVDAGAPYVVGERGPELFVPSAGGTIVPNGAAGGVSVTNHIYITRPLGTPQQIARLVGDAQTASLKNLGVRLPVAG